MQFEQRLPTVSSTASAQYNFPGVPSPFQHQRETFEFIVNNPRCFVFDDIGTGKTFSASWAIHYLMKIGQVKRVLIIAPKSTLVAVWKRTLFQVDHRIDVQVLKGTVAQKLNACDGYGIRIINPDSLHLISHVDFDMIVVDESAMFRKQGTRRSKALKEICKDVPRVVMMTGSPTPEAPTDVWFTARIVCPDRVPRYFGTMRDLLMRKVGQWKWVNRPDADTTLAKMLSGYVIRHTRDDLDLPEPIVFLHEVEPTVQVKHLLKELKDEAAAQVEAGIINGANEAVVRSKMLQVVSGAVKASSEKGRNDVIQRVDVATKFAALRDLLDATSQPIIIYSEFIGALAQILVWLREQKISHRLVIGDTSDDDRLAAFDALQRGEIKVLLAHPKAMAHGLTLTTSNVVLWWEPIDSNEIFDQASGRITRITQTRTPYIIIFVMSALERRVFNNRHSKDKFQTTLLDYLESDEL